MPKRKTHSRSTLHKAIGKALRNSSRLKSFRAYQEYPVNKVNRDYPNGRTRFDWAIPSLKVCIEAMGQQHYKPVNFGGMSDFDAKQKLARQRELDIAKREAALEVGWTYVAIKYNEEVTPELLEERIFGE